MNDTPSSPSPRLWVRNPAGDIEEVELGSLDEVASGELVVGRDAGADITIDDPAISRFHVKIERDANGWSVRDLGSSNGTFVNGDPVSEHDLVAGDQIGIGDSELQFVAPIEPRDVTSQTQSLGTATLDASMSARSQAVLRTLYDVSQRLAKRESRGAVARVVVEALVKGLEAGRGALLLFEQNSIVCQAAYSRGGVALRGFAPSRTIHREIIERREPILSLDVAGDERFRDQQSIVGEEIHSVVAAPIPAADGLAGFLYFDRVEAGKSATNPFVAEDLYAVAVAAQMVGAALGVTRELAELQGSRDSLVRTLVDDDPIVGASPATERVRQFIGRAAPNDATVLILGETGTGKELVARGIHFRGPRAGKPFVAINCAAIPETLVESELFGHEKGAFTGATERKAGRFEVADGGTVFLDEIAELPVGCQAKLLRLLEERCFERVGGTKSVSVDVRVVAATHRVLQDATQDGSFRSDLYYRLNVLSVTLTPLKDRPEDVQLLIEHFLDHFAAKSGGVRKKLSKDARKFLVEHPWPGNVRELRNALEASVILARTDTIEVSDFPESVQSGQTAGPTGRRSRASTDGVPKSLREIERDHIEFTLDSVDWNKSRAAELLGIERSTLYARIKAHQIVPPTER